MQSIGLMETILLTKPVIMGPYGVVDSFTSHWLCQICVPMFRMDTFIIGFNNKAFISVNGTNTLAHSVC